MDSDDLTAIINETAPHALAVVAMYLCQCLQSNDDARGIRQALEQTYELADRATRRAVRSIDRPDLKMACRSGCSYCCEVGVTVRASEVVAIEYYLRTHRTDAELAELRIQLQQTEERLLATPQNRWLHIPCPLLASDRTCSIYPVRPFVCRRHNSMDTEECRIGSEQEVAGHKILINGAHFYTMQLFLDTWGQAIRMVGIADPPCNLTRALNIALSTENVAEQWLRGERVFRTAEREAGFASLTVL